jgi:hypothetical protein
MGDFCGAEPQVQYVFVIGRPALSDTYWCWLGEISLKDTINGVAFTLLACGREFVTADAALVSEYFQRKGRAFAEYD